MFTEKTGVGKILVMGMQTLDVNSSRTGLPYDPAGTDYTSSALQPYSGGADAPFYSGSRALFFSPDGFVYVKDPTISAGELDRQNYRLGKVGISFLVIRVAYDLESTGRPELPNYYEIAVNRYGATTYVRWETTDGGSTWRANVE